MIKADQFNNIPQDLLLAFSSRDDGTMLDNIAGRHADSVLINRRNFCESVGVRYDSCVYLGIRYAQDAQYDCIAEVDGRSHTKHVPEVIADAVFTKVVGCGLFLPVADCIATVVYDPKRRYLAIVHMGRHSTLTDLLPATIRKFVSEGSDVADLRVWMAPAVTKDSYRLDHFAASKQSEWNGYYEKRTDGIYIDMQGYNVARLENAGVLPAHVSISPINTFTSERYFSHSRGDTRARFACVVSMR